MKDEEKGSDWGLSYKGKIYERAYPPPEYSTIKVRKQTPIEMEIERLKIENANLWRLLEQAQKTAQDLISKL